ncbi:MAG: mechanosensitive ion channel [Prevotellaceae bacterium]|nr:mechanosensitive ion channel [Prevotellaceae bacterium]
MSQVTDLAVTFGGRILAALAVFIVGRFLISLINKVVRRAMERRNVDAGVQSFVKSLVSILLMILLILTVISTLGIAITSFAALLASAGVAVGMALSGNLQNFAGGLIILVLRPFKVGDFIECQGVSGTVRGIQIFHTMLTTPDNKIIYVPNGSLSSGNITNYSQEERRRVDFTVGVDYGEDYDKVEKVVREVLAADRRILSDPAPYIALHSLSSSSVDVVIRVWVKGSDYWDVFHNTNKAIYATFNREGINFPFPQLTVHQAKD